MTQQKVDIAVVGGAGHVGLPLALSFANRGHRVLIHDINEASLERIKQGEVPFMEEGAAPLLRKLLDKKDVLHFDSNPASISTADTLIVTIGTPVDEFQNPVFKLVRDCIDNLIPYLQDGQHLVLRSTVYPGTTDWLQRRLIEVDKKVHVSFCPERVVQGKALEEIAHLPQIVSGTTPEAEKLAIALFERIASEVVVLRPIEAEFAKLFNNAYRYIEFAIANEFFMIANSAGVDYHRILEGMSKNYARAKNIPRAGFAAGPCLFKDTMQLAAFSNNRFSLGHAAVLVNEGMVLYVVDQIANQFKLEDLAIGLLGMSFKANNDDNRSSLSYKLKRVLEFRAKAVYTADPFVTNDPCLISTQELIDKSDLLILCVPHAPFKNIDTKGKPVVDIWSFLPAEQSLSIAFEKPGQSCRSDSAQRQEPVVVPHPTPLGSAK